jgi:hypothetical protein
MAAFVDEAAGGNQKPEETSQEDIRQLPHGESRNDAA